MKTALKFLALLVCCAWLSSCENEQDNNAISPRLSHKVKFERDLSDAYRIAREYATSLTNTTRSGDSRQIAYNDVHYLTTEATRATDGFDTLYYVVNYEDDKGFAIIPKNKLLPDVVVLTEQGNYNGEETDNELFNMLMSGAKSYAANSTRKPDSITLKPLPQPQYIDTTTIDTVAKILPKVTAQWGQQGPYNFFCITENNIKAGCEAIALGQIMSYYEHPTSITLTYPNHDISTQILDWDVINNVPNHSHWADECSNHFALARLIREIGEQLEINYNDTVSEADDYAAITALNYFGYTCSDVKDFSINDVGRSLQNDGLVHFSANKPNTEDGHAMIFDGFVDIRRRYRMWEGPWFWPSNEPFPWVLIEDRTTVYQYIHCNLGYDGKSNGWYADGVINTAFCDQLDNINNVLYNDVEYTYNPKIITDIKPE